MKTKIWLLTVMTATLVACDSYFSGMDIKNEFDPDIETVMGDINQYPSLIGGGYSNWWQHMLESGDGDTWRLAVNADVYAGGAGNFGLREHLYYANCEKAEIANTDQNAGFPKDMWYKHYSKINTVRNMLKMIKEKEMVYNQNGEDATYKVLANCYFLMGAYYTELALLFDRCFILTEETDNNNITEEDIYPASKAQEMALGYLDKCIAICNGKSFDNFNGLLPSGVVNNSDKLKRMADFMAARALAYFPRTNTETVDWNKVLGYIEEGLTEDIKATLPLQGFEVWSAAVAGYPEGNQWVRVNMRVINMMAKNDSNAPWPLPADFLNDETLPEVTNSPDARLGTDFVYYPSTTTPSGGLSYAGYQYYSSYVLKRFTETGQPSGAGDLYLFMKAESDLLKAEALLNTNQKGEAIPLINITREGRGQMHDITTSSTNAEVLEAIYYERFVECGFAYAGTTFYDRRRTPVNKFQLTTRSFRQLPVPIIELTFYGLDSYTFGGEPDRNDKYKF